MSFTASSSNSDASNSSVRIGLLGGTFDPVHCGHLLLAEQCREQCRLDAVWFLPSGSPPHKQQQTITSAKHRVPMIQLAIADNPAFSMNDWELQFDGQPTFTVETLQHFHDIAKENSDQENIAKQELFFLMGADSLADLPTWREPKRIMELARLVAVNRGETAPPMLTKIVEQFGESARSRVELVAMPGLEISSSDIRHRVQTGKPIHDLTPPSVVQYIQQHGLYRS